MLLLEVSRHHREESQSDEYYQVDNPVKYGRVPIVRIVNNGEKADGTRLVSERSDVTGKLKRLVAEKSLEKRVLKDIAEGNVWSAPQLARPQTKSWNTVCGLS